MPTRSGYAELHAPPALRDRLGCSWRLRQGAGQSQPTPVLPDGGVDLIWDARALFVAGPDRGASDATLAPGSIVTGVRLAAGASARLLRRAAAGHRRPTRRAGGLVGATAAAGGAGSKTAPRRTWSATAASSPA
jgi:hypothetical protein